MPMTRLRLQKLAELGDQQAALKLERLENRSCEKISDLAWEEEEPWLDMLEAARSQQRYYEQLEALEWKHEQQLESIREEEREEEFHALETKARRKHERRSRQRYL